jgi:bifunctional DNA-binding transcriptional regulator/antitoxin component of YhaV-PrlF toxin-antitoxin module
MRGKLIDNKLMNKTKKVQEKRDLFIQFSEEEIEEMGWEKNQKLSIKVDEETGQITLEPFVKIELEIGDWPREILEFLVGESCERDISVNEVINEVLVKSLNTYDKFKSKTV